MKHFELPYFGNATGRNEYRGVERRRQGKRTFILSKATGEEKRIKVARVELFPLWK
jgi:hypothetical protein